MNIRLRNIFSLIGILTVTLRPNPSFATVPATAFGSEADIESAFSATFDSSDGPSIAVVVGVNQYPELSAGSNLQGCINDANAISELLRRNGFEIVALTDSDANRQNILDTLRQVGARFHGNGRFVFYFAGHGTKWADGSSALLPSDSREGTESYDLGAETVREAIRNIPAHARTVLLDSCFSGGFARNKGLRHVQSRFYKRATSKKLKEVNNRDNNDHISGKSDACYFTASLENQISGEDDFDNKRDGVFTHYLVARLMDDSKSRRWGDVQTDVTGEVSEYMEDTQTPKLAPAIYSDVPVFDGKDDPHPDPNPNPKRTIWDDYNEDHTDNSALQLFMLPDKSVVNVQEKFSFSARIGQNDGYLVLLDRDVDGSVYLLFPKSGQVEDAKVTAGSQVRLPVDPNKSYAPDSLGQERVKAILFSSEENAKALLDAFPKSGASRSKLRKLVEVDSKRLPFYTSTITFEVDQQ